MCPRKPADVLAIIYRHINQHHPHSRIAAAVLGVQGDVPEPSLQDRQGNHLRMSEAEAERPEARRVERVTAPLVPDGHDHDDDGC